MPQTGETYTTDGISFTFRVEDEKSTYLIKKNVQWESVDTFPLHNFLLPGVNFNKIGEEQSVNQLITLPD